MSQRAFWSDKSCSPEDNYLLFWKRSSETKWNEKEDDEFLDSFDKNVLQKNWEGRPGMTAEQCDQIGPNFATLAQQLNTMAILKVLI